MGYDPTIYKGIKESFAMRKRSAEEAAEDRAMEIRQKLPRVGEIDRLLSVTGLRIWQESRRGKEGLAERIAALQAENAALRSEKEELLLAAGYPKDYTDPRYACEICHDSGFVTEKEDISSPSPRQLQKPVLCACMKKELCRATVTATGVGALLESMTFDNFDLGYYPDSDRARSYLLRCRAFARHPEGNLLLLGGTGLGKTHLSAAIAGAAIQNPNYVVFETAARLFSAFEFEQFGRKREDSSESRTEKYFACELLILDDLGAEMTTAFTLSALYDLLSERINRRAPMVISTNLSSAELTSRYTDRITSRLLGEFDPLLFEGRDIRLLKKWK